MTEEKTQTQKTPVQDFPSNIELDVELIEASKNIKKIYDKYWRYKNIDREKLAMLLYLSNKLQFITRKDADLS